MDHVGVQLVEKVQQLSDLELATLLCLVAEQHCIIEADASLLGALVYELQLISTRVFGLSCAIIDCTEKTTLDEFGNGLLVEDEDPSYFSFKPGYFPEQESIFAEGRRTPRHLSPKSPLEVNRKIANVVIAKNLNHAHHQVQTQALELIRGKRIFTRTAVYPAPKRFLFIALQDSNAGTRLIHHLNEHLFISHHHQEEDGLPNLEEYTGKQISADDNASLSSVLRPSSSPAAPFKPSIKVPLFTQTEIETLSTLQLSARLSSDVRAYLHNIVAFLRLHRAVAGGVSALATRHFVALCKALAPLHGLDYVTPSLVALAARKIYPHRVVLATVGSERSLQWGSDAEAVREVLEGVGVGEVLEDVLGGVEVPV